MRKCNDIDDIYIYIRTTKKKKKQVGIANKMK